MKNNKTSNSRKGVFAPMIKGKEYSKERHTRAGKYLYKIIQLQ